MNWIDELKRVASIYEVVGRYIGGIKGNMVRCPFHKEKTPSMSINAAKNMFYCFGCGVGGDPITFVEKIENIPFLDACKKMAEWYGISITLKGPSNKQVAYQKIVTWAEENLWHNSSALNYLRRRGLDEGVIKVFRIGLINENWKDFLEENGITKNLLEDMGITPAMLGLFKNRIVFPILMQGIFLGLGGRSLGSELPKYLNTGFEKKNALFAFDQARTKRSNELVLVEGYLDAIMCYQYNIPAVATLGTAISEEHINLCLQITNNLLICMDGDNAGVNAANKVAQILVSLIKPGHEIKFINLPSHEDPASYLIRNGRLPMQRIGLLEKIWEMVNLDMQNNPEGKVRAYEELTAMLRKIQNSELRYLYLKQARQIWFSGRTAIKSLDDPQHIRTVILLSSLIHISELFDEVADYVLAMDLYGVLYEFREYMIKFYPFDNAVEVGVDCFGLYNMEKLYSIAPFLLNSAKPKIAWLELYVSYILDR